MNVNVPLDSLNAEQQRAVTTLDGPLLVLAGAGTGKTRVVTYRIANLLSQNVRPENILAATFTKKAAMEMQQRVTDLVGQAARYMRISTFHSLGFAILRDHAEHVGLRPGFEVFTDNDARAKLVERILGPLDTSGLDVYLDASAMLREMSLAKNRDISPELLAGGTPDQQLIGKVLTLYDAELQAANMIDLDDMLTLPLQILREQQAARESYQRRFRYVLIDEYQDTNEVQYQLTKLLLSSQRNICVVGDDDQSIYGFRGASIEKIRGFADEFQDATVVRLVRNYRSSQEILSFSNAVIARAKGRMEKKLHSELGPGAKVNVSLTRDEDHERSFIVDRIRRLRTRNTPFSEIAVLVRVLNDQKAITRQLQKSDIPVGPKQPDGVRVMSLHASKGLEWPVVFLPGLEEDNLPHWNAVRCGPDAIEEERRLFYVGATRARRELIISSSGRRGTHARTPSRFLQGFDQKRFVNMERVCA